jgi:OOP family OmpA-OmpF porin
MKTITICLLLAFTTASMQAQFGNILDKAKKKAEEQTEKKVDETVNGKKEAPDSKSGSDAGASTSSDAPAPAGTKVYSKYDFVPGEVILRLEDFSQDAVGDFPDKWNTNSSGEVVTVEGKPGHWFLLTQKGFFIPEFIDSFPQNFTFEFDMLCDRPVTSWGLHVNFCELQDLKQPEEWQSAPNRFTLDILPGTEGNGSCAYDRRRAGTGEGAVSVPTRQFADPGKTVHVSVWRQKERLRVYLNEEKTWDIPKAILPEARLNTLIFSVQLTDGQSHFLVSNLKLAVGAPDTRNKLITEGKWVTHGILFDVNSATIRETSYGTLKEIAGVLKDNPAVRVKIIGHTDADGDDASNLDLSKRRAASVKDALVRDFSIDAGRMDTDGQGESKPVDTNKTAEGKANNRRVEFIKL